MNDRIGMRAMRGDRGQRQKNTDHTHQDSDAAGVGIRGVFRRQFYLRH
jgi:hypothetical protein